MINRTTKLRWRRRVRRGRRQFEEAGYEAEDQLERNFFKRLPRLYDVRRFVIGWILLLVLLCVGVAAQTKALKSYYQELQPVGGGSYTEGLVGNFTNANPIYVTSSVDSSVSRLIFAGLLKYDQNNHLTGDLAASWNIDSQGKVYTIKLRSNLKWQDGQPLTASDVVFTFQTIQNPDASSPLFHAWQGVVVKAVDEQTITFSLPTTLAPFVYGLTTGILPKHSLQKVEPAQLRSAAFNTSRPVGSGPFMWDTLELVNNRDGTTSQNIGMKAFKDYHSGQPKLTQFVIRTFNDENQMASSFHRQEVNAIVGLDRLPDELREDKNIKEYSPSLTAEAMVFLRNDSNLLKDVRVRQALVMAVDVPKLVAGLGYPAILADEPLLHGQAGYSPTLRQLAGTAAQANKLLDDAGWKRPAPDQMRANGATKLELRFFAKNNADYAYITEQVQKYWHVIGVGAKVTLLSDEDLKQAIITRDYDALLHGISIGADPDVFAYWHSSQSDPRSSSRLNLSNYKSSVADKALEGGRSRLDPSLRGAKYQPFLQSWRTDSPAIALYQPRFLYLTNLPLFGFNQKTINSASDRFNNVENWMIRQDYVLKAN